MLAKTGRPRADEAFSATERLSEMERWYTVYQVVGATNGNTQRSDTRPLDIHEYQAKGLLQDTG